MRRYAEDTRVGAAQSRGEIEQTLTRYGATEFGYANQPGKVTLGFTISGRRCRFTIPMPDQAKTPQQHRARWRALLLCIKSKLETVASGIEEFDEAFMAHVVMPGGKTMAEHALPHLKKAYETGKMPPLLGFDS